MASWIKKKPILFFNRNIKYHRTFHIIFFVLLWLDWGNESCFESFMMIISFMKPQLRSIVVLRRGRGGCHNQVMATHTIYYIARAICTLVLAIAVGWQLLTDSICVIAIHCNLSLMLSTIAAVLRYISCRFFMIHEFNNEATDKDLYQVHIRNMKVLFFSHALLDFSWDSSF